MTTDESICGAPTTTEEPCQNPHGDNGFCWIPSHNPGSTEENPQGRSSKFTDDRKEDILNAAKNGTTIEGCARAAGIHHSTLYDWLDQYPDFSEAFNRARAEGEQRLLQSDDVPPTFILERSYGYSKKTEHEHTGEGGGPIQVVFNDSIRTEED